jgi:hypothetical protein
MEINIPWQEPATGAKPCPKCGKADPHYPGELPQECKECGHLAQRDRPYCSEVPVYKDEESV